MLTILWFTLTKQAFGKTVSQTADFLFALSTAGKSEYILIIRLPPISAWCDCRSIERLFARSFEPEVDCSRCFLVSFFFYELRFSLIYSVCVVADWLPSAILHSYLISLLANNVRRHSIPIVFKWIKFCPVLCSKVSLSNLLYIEKETPVPGFSRSQFEVSDVGADRSMFGSDIAALLASTAPTYRWATLEIYCDWLLRL